MIPIILGMLIALFLNDWKDRAENQKYIDRAIHLIEKEIVESQKSVDEVLVRHYAVIDSLEANLENENLSLLEIAENAGGIQYPNVKNIAMRFFVGAKTELIDYKIISTLSELEDAKDIMLIKFEKLMDFAYANMENTDAKTKKAFAVHLANVIDSEKGLSDLYNQYLEEVKGSTE